MSMFKKAVKHEAKLRLAIAGPSGSGKTYSALAIATALGKKVAVVDTESGSASKYADIFEFDVLELSAPFAPEKYVAAIKAAADAGYDVVVLDSLSHAWVGTGGVLDIVDNAAKASRSGNTYMAWKAGTPFQNALIEAIVTAKVHVIGTMRSKTEYVLVKNDRGKDEPRKMGMSPIQRDGFEYEFDVMFDMDYENNAVVSKSRCPELSGAVIHKPSSDVADVLRRWLSGEAAPPPAPWYTKAPDTKTGFRDFIMQNVPHLNDKKLAGDAIVAVLNSETFAAFDGDFVKVDKMFLAEAVAQWHPAPTPTETADLTTGELIPTTATNVSAYATQ